MLTSDFGTYLRNLRGGRSLGQIEATTGVTKSYLSKVERGERGVPSPEILRKLAPALGVGYEELLASAGYLSIWNENAAQLYPNVVPFEQKVDSGATDSVELLCRRAKKLSPEQAEKVLAVIDAIFDEKW